MKRTNFFQFTNGPKVPLPFSDNEYENRLRDLRKIISEKKLTSASIAKTLKKDDLIKLLNT